MLEKVSRNTSIRSFHLLIKCKFFLLKLPMDTAGGAGMCPSPRDPWETSVKRTGVLLPEMQKVADPADISVLFFSDGANFWAILGHFWAILGHLPKG